MTRILIMPTAKRRTTGKAQRGSHAAAQTSARRTRSGPPEAATVKIDVNDLAATQPLATVKARFSEFVDRVHVYRERIVVTRNGVPVAVLINPDELFSIEETLELLSDPAVMAALEETATGEVVTGEQFVEKMETVIGPRPR